MSSARFKGPNLPAWTALLQLRRKFSAIYRLTVCVPDDISEVVNPLILCTARQSNFNPKEDLSSSISSSQSALDASEGIRQSPLGESETEPTLGPSGIQERLNC